MRIEDKNESSQENVRLLVRAKAMLSLVGEIFIFGTHPIILKYGFIFPRVFLRGLCISKRAELLRLNIEQIGARKGAILKEGCLLNTEGRRFRW